MLLLSCSYAFAQFTTEGIDFWFGFMENRQAAVWPVSLEVYVSSRQDAEINLRNASGSFNVNRSIGANSSVKIDVPISFMPIGEGETNLALHLTSDVNVSVYALNKRQFSADGAVILPTKVLGKEYFVMAHREPVGDGTGNDRDSEMLIVATEDNTQIEVTPSVSTNGGWPAGVTQTITLDQGQSYQLKSQFEDLTGTKVVVVDNGNTCANIAVFGGNEFTNVGGCGGNHDHLYEQMFPVSTWGKEFLFVPYETRIGGDYFKVTAAEDGTVVTISGRSPINLDEGETEVIKALGGVRKIDSNKPVQVAQLSRSIQCDNVDSDPFMIMLSPLEQRVTQATFDAFNVVTIDQYYLILITTATGFNDITFDGNNIASEFRLASGAAYASFEFDRGTHTLVAPEGVIAYVYGYGPSESFGYSAGVSLQNLNVQITGEDPLLLTDVISKEGCLNSPIAFSAEFDVEPGQDPLYNTFDWDFGDGSTGTGQDTVHIYDTPGEYEITLIASDGNTTCGGNSEVIVGTVTIPDVEVADDGIIGAVSVCPDVSGVMYTISGPEENTYEWSIEGGNITSTSASGDEAIVDWGAANDDAFIRVIPKNYLGCPGDTITLPVKINKRLEPLLPRGDAEVCFVDFGNKVYSTPATAGSEYEWFIEGGTILSGGNTNEITVAWDGVGTGRVWYREFNPDISDCEGFSEQLEVIVYTELLSVGSIDNVLCNGGSSGAISLTLSGGKPGAYTVSWSNGMTGTEITGLTAGSYDATIRDAIGCELQATYVVTEPDVLEITNSNIIDVRCFEESNGIFSLDVAGGTPDNSGGYTYVWTGNGVNTTTTDPMLPNLPTGNYTVLVRDSNGCETSMDFFIDEPELLEADLETLINQPICPDASNGTAYLEAKGGTPDYQFFWSNDPTTDQQEGMNFSRGTYTVRIVDANGCETTQEIEVTERFPKIFLPNAFSPNGDGENDTFKPVTDCNLNYSMQIFNEWGAVTFATNDIFEGWDGTLEGEPVPDGKYSYIVFYSGSLNGVSFEETLRGTLRLYR